MQNYLRRKLINLVHQVSESWGGDEDQFLNEYIAEVLRTWDHDLSAAIRCFQELVK